LGILSLTQQRGLQKLSFGANAIIKQWNLYTEHENDRFNGLMPHKNGVWLFKLNYI